MKKIIKKSLSRMLALILTFAMVVTIMPLSALARSTGTVNIYVTQDGTTTFVKSYSYTQNQANDSFQIPSASAAGVSGYGQVDYVRYDGSGYTGSNQQPGYNIQIRGNFRGMNLWYVMEDTAPERYSYYLYYNANGGSSAPGMQYDEFTTNTSSTFTVSSQEPTRSGYEFLGWSTQSGNYNNVNVGPYFTVYSSSPSKTLYAVWQEEVSYDWTQNITYKYSDGSTYKTDTYNFEGTSATSSGTCTLSAYPKNETGYTYEWNTYANGTGAAYTVSYPTAYNSHADATLYLIEKAPTPVTHDYSIKYYRNYAEDSLDAFANFGQSVESEETEYSFTALDDSRIDEPENYKFMGWSTDRYATTAQYQAGDSVPVTANSPDVKLYAVWAETFTVTYSDGVQDEEIFDTQVNESLLAGASTPVFDTTKCEVDDNGKPAREGYVFAGWTPELNEKVDGSQEYTATWAKEYIYTWNFDYQIESVEDAYIKYKTKELAVDFTEGLFVAEQLGVDPEINNIEKEDEIFLGWSTSSNGEVAFESFGEYVNSFGGDVVDGMSLTAPNELSMTYYAIWADDLNGNDEDDATEPKYTITYKDGDDAKVFEDQITEVLVDLATPAFDTTDVELDDNGLPAREGYIFTGWSSEVAEKVTDSCTYTATWEKVATPSNTPSPTPAPSEEPSDEPSATPAPSEEPSDEPTATPAPTEEPQSDNPTTGDNGGLAVVLASLVVSAIGIFVIAKKRIVK